MALVADYAVPSGEVACHDKTLTPGDVDCVTFVDDFGEVEVTTDGTDAVYFTVDGSDPELSGGSCHKVWPADIAVSVAVSVPVGETDGTVVRLWAASAVAYGVERAD